MAQRKDETHEEYLVRRRATRVLSPEQKERARQRTRAWYKDNRDKALAYGKAYGKTERGKQKNAESRARHRKRYLDYFKEYNSRRPAAMKMFNSAKHRAKELGIPFTITPEDVVIPERCPILNIPLDGETRDTTPSLDRVVPELGYVPGNVDVISMRANRIKYDASEEELERILDYVKKHKRAYEQAICA